MKVGALWSIGTLAVLAACSAGGGADGDAGGDADRGQGANSGSGSSSGTSGGSNGFGLATGAGGAGGATICENYEAVSEPNPPVILVLLDQSGSMKDVVGSTTRWAAATSSLFDATAALESSAEFGLVGFPRHIVTSDTTDSQTCAADLKVVPTLNAAAAIEDSIELQTPVIGHTPVRAAINVAADELTKEEYSERDKYIVLVTDGLPNCAPGATERWHIDPGVAELIEELYESAGIRTFVVGYDIAALPGQWSPPNETYFAVDLANAMAEAGGTEAHRPVSSGPELVEVLTDITRSVAPCSFELDAAPRGGPGYVRVTIDGEDYAFEDADGWTLEGSSTVALAETGAACQLLRDGGTHSIQIQVECDPVVILR